jgi:hypothetical protein
MGNNDSVERTAHDSATRADLRDDVLDRIPNINEEGAAIID